MFIFYQTYKKETISSPSYFREQNKESLDKNIVAFISDTVCLLL